MTGNAPVPRIIPVDDDDYPFPAVEQALKDPDGLLAIGGSLRPKRLLGAYKQGIFPWFNDEQPVLWWSPNPRLVLYPQKIKVSRSLAKARRKRGYTITFDKAFRDVMINCAQPRPGQDGTWITPSMIAAYSQLHNRGYAHSVEAWKDGGLVGGLYGVTLGQVFFGESMFATQRDASKIAFVELVENLQTWGYKLIDCQVNTAHLISLGAEDIPRSKFLHLIETLTETRPRNEAWGK